jgi:hypothetical protein
MGMGVRDDLGGVFDPAQQRDVVAPDRRSGGVLDREHDPYGAAGPVGLGPGPAVTAGVVADELHQCLKTWE